MARRGKASGGTPALAPNPATAAAPTLAVFSAPTLAVFSDGGGGGDGEDSVRGASLHCERVCDVKTDIIEEKEKKKNELDAYMYIYIYTK